MKSKNKDQGKSLFSYIILAAVLIIPFMYSFFYLKAYWNPYGKGNIDNLPVAIVNEDKGERGKQLISSLEEKNTLKLSIVSSDEATDGLYNKDYYAVITIPEDFTSSIESVGTENKKHPTITYSPNQKSNYLASQIIDKVMTTVEKSLDKIDKTLKEISNSNNRMANYFSGNWLLTMDERNLPPQRNLYQDIKDAVNNIERPDENLLGRDENCRMK